MLKKILWGLLLCMFFVPFNKELANFFARLLGGISSVYGFSFLINLGILRIFKKDSALQRMIIVILIFLASCAINTFNLRSIGASSFEVVEGIFIYSIGLLVSIMYFINRFNDRQALIVSGYTALITLFLNIIFGVIAGLLGMTKEIGAFITFISMLFAIPAGVIIVQHGKMPLTNTQWVHVTGTNNIIGALILWGSVIFILLLKIVYEIVIGVRTFN